MRRRAIGDHAIAAQSFAAQRATPGRQAVRSSICSGRLAPGSSCMISDAYARLTNAQQSVPVAQLDRVLGYGPRGWGFESLRVRHSDNRGRFLYFMLLCCSLVDGLPFVGGQSGPADSRRYALFVTCTHHTIIYCNMGSVPIFTVPDSSKASATPPSSV